ncbi:hypothetical protein H6G28_10120 [Nostoc sp. FACHB-190]|nr:hypothetical protein [Nostoc sp. FACHB-190]
MGIRKSSKYQCRQIGSLFRVVRERSLDWTPSDRPLVVKQHTKILPNEQRESVYRRIKRTHEQWMPY